MTEVKAGTILIFSTGEYSDWSIVHVAKTAKDMDPEAALLSYKTELSAAPALLLALERNPHEGFELFYDWLFVTGVVEPACDTVVVHLDDNYSRDGLKINSYKAVTDD